MTIDLEPLFNSDGTFAVDYRFDAQKGFLPGCRMISPVRVSGSLKSGAGMLSLEAVAAYSYSARCDRCAKEFTRSVTVPVRHYLAASLNNEENDDYILVGNMRFDMDSLVSEDILLDFPARILCFEDCGGLCMVCGADLNEGACSCEKPVDPRLSELAKLLGEKES